MRLLISVLFLSCGLASAVPTINSGECDLIDYDGETVMRKITFDLEAERICSGAGCLDANMLQDGNSAFVFVTVDEAARMNVFYIPGCWNREDRGYVHYSGNNNPYYLKNCNMGRACDFYDD